jgi:hypothetical protein
MNSAIGLVTKKPVKANAHEEVVSIAHMLIKYFSQSLKLQTALFLEKWMS